MTNDQTNQASRKQKTVPQQNAPVTVNRNRRTSDAPRYVTNNTRSHGNALIGLPKAALVPLLLEPTNPHARTLNANGTLNYNVAFLALGPTLQARRKKLVINISELLGDNMNDWHAALHRPQGLLPNALDWSTVLLQQTLGLAKSVPPSNVLKGVHQAMTVKKMSVLVKAALHLHLAEPTSDIGIEICDLRDKVLKLQKDIDSEMFLEEAMHELKTQTLDDKSEDEFEYVEEVEAPEIALQQKIDRLEQENSDRWMKNYWEELRLYNRVQELEKLLSKVGHLSDSDDESTVWEDVE
jgi:hypothetical protein